MQDQHLCNNFCHSLFVRLLALQVKESLAPQGLGILSNLSLHLNQEHRCSQEHGCSWEHHNQDERYQKHGNQEHNNQECPNQQVIKTQSIDRSRLCQIKAMSILTSPITDDVLRDITNFEDPCDIWLHLQINMRSKTQPTLFPHAQSLTLNPFHCLQVNLRFQNCLDLNPQIIVNKLLHQKIRQKL